MATTDGTDFFDGFIPFVTTNVPDFNHHKGAKTLRTPRISKLFLFFVPWCPCALGGALRMAMSRHTSAFIAFQRPRR
jgi:hypothetical protein